MPNMQITEISIKETEPITIPTTPRAPFFDSEIPVSSHCYTTKYCCSIPVIAQADGEPAVESSEFKFCVTKSKHKVTQN